MTRSDGARRPAVFIHDTAVVESGAALGEGSKVWHHAHVRSGAVIGEQTVLGKNVFVDSGAVIGDRCAVQNNVSVYTGVRLGNEVFVGPSAVFTNDLVPRAFNPSWTITPTVVHDGCSIGANATIVCGAVLGEHSMIGAGSVVTRPVRAHQLVAGNPARHRGWVCGCGLVISRADQPPDALHCPDHQPCPAESRSQ